MELVRTSVCAVRARAGTDASADNGGAAEELARIAQQAAERVPELELRLITNRGVKVWPHGFPETTCVDHWRCRFRPRNRDAVEVPFDAVLRLLGSVRAHACAGAACRVAAALIAWCAAAARARHGCHQDGGAVLL